MSDHVAVDVVLLPPEDVTNKAIELNKKYGQQFTLDKNNCLPHITLLQAVLPKSKLSEAESILNGLALEFDPINLTAELTNTPALMFIANKAPELMKLHEEVMERFQSLVSYDARPEYFYNKDAREKTVDWVRNFVPNSAYSNYMPHITISTTGAPSIKDSVSFTCNRLAICHLGNFNTCRKVLFDTGLNKS